jgi:AraC family transcriptional regulator of adaptative response/methylated-DNA-[protein]-cysteine methyltransferase
MTLNSSASRDHMIAPSAGQPDTVTFGFGTSALGEILVAATTRGICAILLGSNRERLMADLHRHFPQAQLSEGHVAEIDRVVSLIEDPTKPQDLELDLQGSDLEIKVWQALRTIPPGKTLSYSELARLSGVTGGEKGPAKEVADACAANRIAVAVPCHRILRKDGSISGYRWGVQRKRQLLEREGAL